jgi:hypothetical protein
MEDRLFVGLAKVENDWLWHSGRIGNTMEFERGCFSMCVVEKAKDSMGSIAASEEPTA